MNKKQAKSASILQVKKLKNRRIRYFEVLQKASIVASLRFLNQRVNLIEERLNEENEKKFSNYFFDALLGVAISNVGGAILAKIAKKYFKDIIEVRSSLLVVEEVKDNLELSIQKDKFGNLIHSPIDFSKRKEVRILKNVVKDRRLEKDSILWKAGSELLSNTVKDYTNEKSPTKQLKQLGKRFSNNSEKVKKEKIEPEKNAIDITEALIISTERQIDFEIAFFDYIISTIDSKDQPQNFIDELIFFATKKMRSNLSELLSSFTLFARHFELCMWVIYIENLQRLAGGYIPPSIAEKQKEDVKNRYQRRGNYLLKGRAGGTTDFKPYKIFTPKLVDYLLKEMIHPKSKKGKSIFEHFIEMKAYRQRIPKNELSEERERLGHKFLSLKDRPHLYKEMVATELIPILSSAQKEVKKLVKSI